MKCCFKKKVPVPAPKAKAKEPADFKIIGRPEDVAKMAFLPVPQMPLMIPRLLDPFQPRAFGIEAQIVFHLIMGAFVKGWLKSIQDLVTPTVMSAFQKAVQERVDKEWIIEFQVYDTTIEVLQETLTPKHVKVEITSQQGAILKDKKGNIVFGNPDVLQEVQEIWQFERGEKRWLLSGIEHK